MASVLIIDDDKLLCESITNLVNRMGHNVIGTHTIENGLKEVNESNYDVVFLDVNLPDGNGLRILPKIRELPSSPQVIIITGFGDPDGAEWAIKNGAWDYLEKTSSLKKVSFALSRALQYRLNKPSKQSPVALKRDGIIGESQPIQVCLDQLAQATTTESNVFITGETGTGKELFAWAIHENSSRSDKPYVIVDCAALPEYLTGSVLFGHEKGSFTGADRNRTGLIKRADQGTLFLDEVGELPLPQQKSFLRFLETRRFLPIGGRHEIKSDFRLISATNRDLDKMVAAGQFRKDLLFRLRALTIDLPPLIQHREDIKQLAIHYLNKICERYSVATKGFATEVFSMLTDYYWPGNVRELVHCLENAFSKAQDDSTLMPWHLPVNIRIHSARSSIRNGNVSSKDKDITTPKRKNTQTWQDFKKEMEGHYLNNLMNQTSWDIPQACQISKISRPHIYELLKKNGISRNN